MEGHARISSDVLASYAADAAREVPGVRGLVESTLHRHRGVRVTAAKAPDSGVTIELHLDVDWGASIPDVGRAVQERVAEYLRRMADVRLDAVDVVVESVAGG